MRMLSAILALVFVLSGCFGGDEGEPSDDETPTGTSTPTASPTTTAEPGPEPEPEPGPPEQLHFTFGPSAGCIGDAEGSCVSFQSGPTGPPVDGFWIELDERYWGLSFTSTIDSFLGDSDCWFVAADATTIRGDANNGSGPCEGRVPNDTGYIFLYPYVEPAQGMTLTFKI